MNRDAAPFPETPETIDAQLVTRVFGSILSLERAIHSYATSFEARRTSTTLGRVALYDQVIKKMQASASRLQFAVAKRDWVEAVRNLQIIYGLNHIVKPEIVALSFGSKSQSSTHSTAH